MVLNDIVDILRKGERFFLASHKDPDGDAIGSVLALSETLILSGKEVVVYNSGPIPDSLFSLTGTERIVTNCSPETEFDAFFILDCGNLDRVGRAFSNLSKNGPLVNIDHHEKNTRFGDVNLVDAHSSSVGEIIYRLIKAGDFPITVSIAENIFVAIQTDTGSFRYENTTKETFNIAGELLGWGLNPWRISRKVAGEYTARKLKLLESALGTIELHHEGRVGLITVTKQMLSEARVDGIDSDSLVDYPRGISGVEIAVLIKEIDGKAFRFSLRSNDWVNVAELAGHMGGGGHARAAAYTREGSLRSVKQGFLNEARGFLKGK